MPTYQYRCAKCGEQFELWQSIHDEALTRHPGCGGAVMKVLAPAGIVLKGSGFYRTDSRVSAAKSREARDGGDRGEKKEKGAPSDSPSGNGSASKDSTSSSTASAKNSGDPSKKGGSST